MTDNRISANGSRPVRGYKFTLNGKVVLLVGNDTVFLRSMVTSFAQKGADIALIGWQLSQETVNHIRENVENQGRNLLILTDGLESEKANIAEKLIQSITAKLGRLDVFIDLSAEAVDKDPAVKSDNKGAILPNWKLAQAALEAIANS